MMMDWNDSNLVYLYKVLICPSLNVNNMEISFGIGGEPLKGAAYLYVDQLQILVDIQIELSSQ